MQKEMENVEFVQSLNVEISNALENNNTKYLWIFDGSCKELFEIANHLLVSQLLEGIIGWAQYTRTTFFIKSNFVDMLTSTLPTWFVPNLPLIWSNWSLLVWDKSVPGLWLSFCSHHAQLTSGSGVATTWPVSKRNNCTLRTLINWRLVATNRRSITLPYKHWIHFLNLYPPSVQTFKVFGRWKHWISLHYKCFNRFPTNAKILSFIPLRKIPAGFSSNA